MNMIDGTYHLRQDGVCNKILVVVHCALNLEPLLHLQSEPEEEH